MKSATGKIAIISDIHGNAQALSEVVSDIKNNSVDSIICLGDIATLGPSPRETIKIVSELGCPCLVGNHEEALFSPEKSAQFDLKSDMLKNTIYWCLDKLSPDDMSFLKKSVNSLTVHLPNGKNMLCYHGSSKSSTDSIGPKTPDGQLDSLIEFDDSLGVAIGGHTHFQMFRKYRDVAIVNPGSIGCAFRTPSFSPPAPSFNPVAEYAVVECTDNSLSVNLKTVEYDVKQFIALIRSSNSPLIPWWEEEFSRMGM